jgi:hypothetical protein
MGKEEERRGRKKRMKEEERRGTEKWKKGG